MDKFIFSEIDTRVGDQLGFCISRMEEHQVTIDGETRRPPSPFFVPTVTSEVGSTERNPREGWLEDFT